MKTRSKSFMSFVLIFVMMFSSLGVFAVDGDASPKEDSIVMGGYTYFSDTSNEGNIYRVSKDAPTDEPEKVTTTGSAIHLSVIEGDDYFYYYLNDPTDDNKGIYRLDVNEPDDDSGNATFTSTKISITPPGTIVASGKTISKLILTKADGKDVIYFIEIDPESTQSSLRKLVISGNPDKPNLEAEFRYKDSTDPISFTTVKNIYISGDYLAFTYMSTDNKDITKRLTPANPSIISDITLQSFTIKKLFNGVLEEIPKNNLILNPGNTDITLVADIDPLNTTTIDFKWTSGNTELATITPATTDSSRAVLKLNSSAKAGDSTTIMVFDEVSKQYKAIVLTVKEKENTLKEIKFAYPNISEIGAKIVLEKEQSIKIPLVFVGEIDDLSKSITDIENIKSKIKATPSDANVSATVVAEDDGSLSIKITGVEITPETTDSKITVKIDGIEEYKDISLESKDIRVKEIVKPTIKIKPVVPSTDISLVHGKTLDFELFMVTDGEDDKKIDQDQASKITWSAEKVDGHELISIAPANAENDMKTTITALKAGKTSLKATYKYDGDKNVTSEINITVIEDEYGEYDEWTDEKTPTSVPSNKIWTIKFNQLVDEGTVNSRTIFVKKRLGPDSEVLYDDTITYISGNGKSIEIKPIIPYSSGEYFLYIENIKNENGQQIKKNIKMKFTVK